LPPTPSPPRDSVSPPPSRSLLLFRFLLRSSHNATADVTDPEPLPTSSPLLGLPNLVVVPHIARYVPDCHLAHWPLHPDDVALTRPAPLPHCAPQCDLPNENEGTRSSTCSAQC
jgi:hypothetical protein